MADGRSAGADAPAIAIAGLSNGTTDRTVLTTCPCRSLAGELVALLGPTVRASHDRRDRRGLPPGDGGRVRVLGQDPASAGAAFRARVGLMLQGGGIDPRSQPRETLVQFGRFDVGARDADELLELVGLRAVARTPYRRLSGGEQQRIGLAVALVGRPEVSSSTSRRPGWTRKPGP